MPLCSVEHVESAWKRKLRSTHTLELPRAENKTYTRQKQLTEDIAEIEITHTHGVPNAIPSNFHTPNHTEAIPEPVPHQPKYTLSKTMRNAPTPFRNHPGNTQGLLQPLPNRPGIIYELIMNRYKHSQTFPKPIPKPLPDHSRTTPDTISNMSRTPPEPLRS